MSRANHMEDLMCMTHLGKGGEDRKRIRGLNEIYERV